MIENSVIIPVFGNQKLVHNLLNTLLPTLDKQCEVIVVDDGHADMKIDPQLLPQGVIYLSNKENIGYSAAVNTAIDQAKGEYITTVNSDMLMDVNWLKETRKTFREMSGIGMLGAKLVYPSNDRIMHAGIFFGKGFAFNAFRMTLSDDPLINELTEVPALCDALATMSKDAVMNAGKYDEAYFTSVEDLEMCLRFRRMGLKNIYNPKIIGFHKTAASKEHRYKQITRDEQLFFQKWQSEIADNTHEIFQKSLKRGIGPASKLPNQAYVVNLNRKNNQVTLESFISISGIEVISLFDYTSYVENTPRYQQETNLELLEILPFGHLNLRYPVVYIVDFFISLKGNTYWQQNRRNQSDLVFDHAFNFFYLKDIIKAS